MGESARVFCCCDGEVVFYGGSHRGSRTVVHFNVEYCTLFHVTCPTKVKWVTHPQLYNHENT